MPLDTNQQQQLSNWMNAKGVRPICPACAANNWQTGEVVAPPIVTGAGINLGGPSVPTVQLICGRCAYVMSFAAVPMGLTS